MEPGLIESKKVWVGVLHIYTGLFILGYTLAVFNTSAMNISWTYDWGSNEVAYTNLFSTIIPAGVAIGCLTTGPSISKYGRRKTYLFAGYLYLFGTGILLCPFTVMFGIGRMLTGISAGIFGVLSPIYANEITPEAMVGKTGAYISIMSSFGVIFAYVFGLPLPISPGSDFNYWWMFMFLFPAAVVVYLLIYFTWVHIYDTPQYYMEKNLEALAMKALRISYTEAGTENGLKRLQTDFNNAQTGTKRANVLTIFCDRKFSKMIRIGFIRVAFFQFSGIFTLLFYSTAVFGKIGGETMLSRGLTVVFGVVLLVANFLFIPVAKCFRRKTIFVWGDVFLALLMVGAGVAKSQNTGVEGPAVLLLVFVLVFGSSVGSVTWMYLAEILNPQILVVVSMYSWVIQVIITLLFPILASFLDISVLFYMFAGVNALGALYSACDMVETKGMLKEDVIKSLNAAAEDNTTERVMKNDRDDNEKEQEVLE